MVETFHNHFLYKDGVYSLDHWLALGYLICCHEDIDSLKQEFWQLINPKL